MHDPDCHHKKAIKSNSTIPGPLVAGFDVEQMKRAPGGGYSL